MPRPLNHWGALETFMAFRILWLILSRWVAVAAHEQV
jgi:hypothetical protein